MIPPTMQYDTWLTIGDAYFDAVSYVGDLNINNFSTNSWSFGGTPSSDALV